MQFHCDKCIDTSDWSSDPPHRNPAEDLWQAINQCTQSHQIEPQTGQELTDVLIWVLEEILKGKLIFIPSNPWSAGFFPHLKVFQVHVHEFIWD